LFYDKKIILPGSPILLGKFENWNDPAARRNRTTMAKHRAIFHSDCVQTFGKIRIDVQKMFIDSLSISAHKIHGPKERAGQYILSRASIGNHVFLPLPGFRPGTVNMPGIASFITAAQHIGKNIDAEQTRFEQLRPIHIFP
jgi:cysteine desulfurase